MLLKENEDVVQAALKANGDRYTLGYALPPWTHRGLAVFPGGEFRNRLSDVNVKFKRKLRVHILAKVCFALRQQPCFDV